MEDISVLTINTPYVRAKRKTELIAEYTGMPSIYHKDFDINEFIGEELAGIRGVNSVHYFPVLFDDIDSLLQIKDYSKKRQNIRVGSFDFKVPGVIYSTGPNLPYYEESCTFDDILYLCRDDKNREELINELLEIYALDIYSGQTDRPNNIFYEFHPNGEIHISKLFDYEWSLDPNLKEYYVADFHIFRTISDYQKFIIKYPQFEIMLRSYLDVNLEEVIKKMARFRKFDLSRVDIDSYKRFDEKSHKKLEKILR